jgi:hypothetical protein
MLSMFRSSELRCMRALLVIGSLADAVIAARAADYDGPLIGSRAGSIIIYDYEPGVTVREYWLPPWHNHHYFPRGRTNTIQHHSALPRRNKPAQSFHREWSTSSECGVCAADGPSSGLVTGQDAANLHDGNDAADRVIHADADVTILGPDRMDIHLFRKPGKSSQ